jgi:hypothetical protein
VCNVACTCKNKNQIISISTQKILSLSSKLKKNINELIGRHDTRWRPFSSDWLKLTELNHLKVSGRFEGFVAYRTGKLALTVHILSVAVHAARAAESLTAIRTRVRKLARVLPHVDVQPVLVNEPDQNWSSKHFYS